MPNFTLKAVRLTGLSVCMGLLIAACIVGYPTFSAAAGPAAAPATFTLENGMLVCVIPDRRAPVVTHMVWYRIGAADDPSGSSGLAHFLEHMMFKGTKTTKSGDLTRIVTGLGGRHNALTTHDTTSYFQRGAKEHLRRFMELEADRMRNLVLTDEEALTERDVVREERRGSVDGAPISALNEQVLAQLYQNHPYGRPVLGWTHEIIALSKSDAVQFYNRNYVPSNAVLVVAGDVTPDEVQVLANSIYGKIAPGNRPAARKRPSEPDAVAARWVRLEDPRAGAPLLLRYYLAPSQVTAKAGEAEALSVLARILGGDDTSRLYRRLVIETKFAVQAGADYQGNALDSGRLSVLALASEAVSSSDVEAQLDAVIREMVEGEITADELRRAKRALEAEHIFQTDNQERRARRYGEALTFGRSLEDIEGEQQRIQAVTASDVARVARAYLDSRRSVTGVLMRPSARTTKE